MKSSNLLFVILSLMMCVSLAYPQESPKYKDTSLPAERRVSDLLSRMTLEEKIAQITHKKIILDEQHQFDFEKNKKEFKYGISIASLIRPNVDDAARYANDVQRFNRDYSRLGIPALFGAEGLHGYMAKGATVFPQAIALASTWDIDLIEKVASAIALEMRAQGAHKTLCPVLGLAREPRWGRTEETFGEDPYLVSRIGLAFVQGLQGTGSTFLDKNHVISEIKHFAVHSQPEGGISCGPGNYSERIVRENFLVPFEVAVRQGNALAIMATYNEIDGIPMTANCKFLTSILRDEWGFKGLVGPDQGALDQLYTKHAVAAGPADAVKKALQAGVDIFGLRYSPNFKTLMTLYRDKQISQDQIDAAVSRMLLLKFKLGLFEKPYVDAKLQYSVLNCQAHRQLALKAAQQAIILLKNENNILPLNPRNIKNFAVIGPNADDIHLGAYTIEPRVGISVLEGIKKFAEHKFNVHYPEGCKITLGQSSWWENENPVLSDPESDALLIAEAVKVARKCDVVLLVLGGNEATCREAWGKGDVHLGDRDSLELIGRQNDLVKEILKTGKPVVVLLINGRPLTINYIAENVPAILEGWYLGQETGTAVADVLFGKVNPGGKLPITFARSVGQLPCYYNRKPSQNHWDYAFAESTPLYPFGFGLSYTTFSYANLKVSPEIVKPDQGAEVTVEVTNTGDRAGDEVVQMYIRDVVSSVTRPVKELKGFERVHLEQGETKAVAFEVTPEKLRFYNVDMERVVEPGEFEIMVGTSSVEYLRSELQVAE